MNGNTRPGTAAARGRAPKIALSMIVKNEAHCIARCIESVKPLITNWCIVDTGSTDGTQSVVRAALADLPGALHERPWQNFAHNRNEALELAAAKADYVLVMDADDYLDVGSGFALPDLVADAYKIRIVDTCTSYWRTHLFRTDRGFHYTGVLHEVLVADGPRREERLEGLVYRRTARGARSTDPDKYRKDAAVLERALAEEPHNARYAFYLAQSWRDAGELEKALAAYEKRASMGGWEEEAWYARLEVAKLTARLGRPDAQVIAAYLAAYERRPTRAESLCYLASHLRQKDRAAAAYPFARAASEILPTNDVLFVDESVYAWRAQDEYAVAAYWVGRYAEAFETNERLLGSSALPPSERPRIEKNIAFCREKLGRA